MTNDKIKHATVSDFLHIEKLRYRVREPGSEAFYLDGTIAFCERVHEILTASRG